LAVGGVAFSLNPYFTVWLENRVFVAGLATLPISLWAMERILTRRSIQRELAILTVSFAYATLAGTLQTMALFLLFFAVRLGWVALATHEVRRTNNRRAGVLLFAAFAAGLMLGALPLMSGVEMLTHSTRLGSGGYYAGSNSLPLRTVALWFNPGAFGLPNEGDFTADGRRFMSGSGFGYLGVVPLGLAGLALVRRKGPFRERIFWGGLSGITLAFLFLQAMPFHAALVGLWPWLSDVDLLRGLIVVNLGGVILAGWGAAELACLWKPGIARRTWLIPWVGYLVLGTMVVVICRLTLSPPHALWRDLLPILIPGSAVIGIGLAPLKIIPRPGDRILILVVLSALELGRFHFAINTFARASSLYPPHEAVTRMERMLGGPTHPRYLVEGSLRIFPPNTGSVYGMTDVRGYSNIPIARYRALLECAEHRTDLKNLPTLNNLESPIYSLLGVAYVFAIEPFESPVYERVWNRLLHHRLNCLPRAFIVHEASIVADEKEMRQKLSDPRFDPAEQVYLEAKAGPLPSLSSPRAKETLYFESFCSNRVVIQVTTTGRGILVLSDAYFPGWGATVDGRPARILPADWGLRGVTLPEGTHEVVFRYRPGWLVPGTALMLTGFFLLLGLFLGKIR
jgi:membrane protein YfhO